MISAKSSFIINRNQKYFLDYKINDCELKLKTDDFLFHPQLKTITFRIYGCRLCNTGQVLPVFSRIFLDRSSIPAGNVTTTSIFEIRLGLAAIVFTTIAVVPSIFTFRSFAFMPITVILLFAKSVASLSVEENASPLPWLSVGASVT